MRKNQSKTTRCSQRNNRATLKERITIVWLSVSLSVTFLMLAPWAARAQSEEMGWWDEFSLARLFDSPIVFGTVMGVCVFFVLVYIIMAIKASRLEESAAAWAGNRRLAELVDALGTPNDHLAFVQIRKLRSERLFSRLLKDLPGEDAAAQIHRLTDDLPKKDETEKLQEQIVASGTDKKTRRKALLRLFELRDEELRRLLMSALKQAKSENEVSVSIIYLLEDLGASEARPFLERLLSAGKMPAPILKNALRRIPYPNEAKAK